MHFEPKQLLLYGITDRASNPLPLYEQVEQALAGGVTLLQLREKNVDADRYIQTAKALLPLCHRYGVPLIINDSVFVAQKSGADGVHVGIEDTPVSEIRKQAGTQLILGATAKTTAQALAAARDGADYLGVGAVFPSPTKKNAIRITPEELSEICRAVHIPAVAIGGIGLQNAESLQGCGMAGLAVVSALFAAADIQAAAQALRQTAERVCRC